MIPSTELALALGIGIGFTRVAGMRAFLSLVLYTSFTIFGHPPHLFLQICPLHLAMVLLRMAAGAVVFATVIAVRDPFEMRGRCQRGMP